MRRRTTLRLAAALLAQALAAAPLAAQTGYGQTFTAPDAPNTVLQLLTIGPTGLYGETTGEEPMVARLFAYDGGAIVGSSIFEQALGYDFAGLTVTPNVALTPGGQYVFVTYLSGGQGSFLGSGFAGNPYADGEAVVCDPTACSPLALSPQNLGNDLNGFEVRFGPASVVPEPATWALLGTGLVALGGVARARRRVAGAA